MPPTAHGKARRPIFIANGAPAAPRGTLHLENTHERQFLVITPYFFAAAHGAFGDDRSRPRRCRIVFLARYLPARVISWRSAGTEFDRKGTAAAAASGRFRRYRGEG